MPTRRGREAGMGCVATAGFAMIMADPPPRKRVPTMSDTISETKACDLLARIFRSRGYAILRNVTFREYGVDFHADGWDAKARVGFEFLSSEDDDHDDLTLREYKTLMDAQQRGELSLFIIDEVEPVSAADLASAANEFLDEMEAAVKARWQAAARKKSTKPALKKSAKVVAAGRPKQARAAAKKPRMVTKKVSATKKKPAAAARRKPVKKTGAVKKRRVGR